MSSEAMHEFLETVEAEVQSRPTPTEFEMAYQARVAIDRIRFAIKHTEQFGPRTDEMRETGLATVGCTKSASSRRPSIPNTVPKPAWSQERKRGRGLEYQCDWPSRFTQRRSSAGGRASTHRNEQAAFQQEPDFRESESLAMSFERVLNTEEAAALLKFIQRHYSAWHAGSGPSLPYRGPVAVSRFLAGSVASFWIMLKEPLVPLTRKEGLRCLRARDISMEVLRRKNGRKERRYGSFATTRPMPGANVSAGPSWSEHWRSIQPNPRRGNHRWYRRSCYGSMRSSRLRPVPPILER